MPNNRKNVTEKQESASEQAPDFAELQKQKEDLFKEIEGKSLELDKEQKCRVVSLVLSHSIKDGFELARRLGVGGIDFALALSAFVARKNWKFLKEFELFVKENENYADLNNAVKVEMIRTLEDTSSNRSGFAVNEWQEMQKWPCANEINDYYLNFIRNRKVASPEMAEDSRTRVEEMAEDHLKTVETILEESYYTGPIREALGIGTEEQLQAKVGDDNAWADNIWALRNNLITKRDLYNVLARPFGKRLDDEDIKKVLEKACYTPSKVVFETRKKEAEKGLIEQIKQSLIKRGYKEG